MARLKLSDDPIINWLLGYVPERGVEVDPESFLLDQEAFEQVLVDMINASFPLGWAPAKRRLRADRLARTLLMRTELDEGGLRAQAEVQGPDELVELLERALEHMPDDLADEAREILKKW